MAKKLTDIPGIGPATALLMEEQGFKSVLDVAKTSMDMMVVVRGFGPIRAGHVIAAAKKLIEDPEADTNDTAPRQETGKETIPESTEAKKREAEIKIKSSKNKKQGKKDKSAKKKAKKKKEKVKEKKKGSKSGKSAKKEKKKSGKKGEKSAKGKKK